MVPDVFRFPQDAAHCAGYEQENTGKAADLVIIGEETEVDKNVLDNLSDPLMHLIRNAMDHGLETPEERTALGQARNGARSSLRPRIPEGT